MNTHLRTPGRTTLVAVLLAAVFGSAQAPPPPSAPPEPDVRLVYESDTRAYYRPCG
jgi:hypothetical protein